MFRCLSSFHSNTLISSFSLLMILPQVRWDAKLEGDSDSR